MRLLLDTHATYWYIEGDPKLSSTAQTLIQDAEQRSPHQPSVLLGNCHQGKYREVDVESTV